MFNITKETKGDVLVVTLSGSLEESIDFGQMIGPAPSKMEIHCKDVSRINSVGVKAWISYFQKCHSNGIQVKFLECSTAIVEQINLISNFIAGGIVESIFLPFACSNCELELSNLFNVEDLAKDGKAPPTMECPKCHNQAKFDDIPEEYLAFIYNR